jgi:hypothetical protein
MRYIQHPKTFELIPADQYHREPTSSMIMSDIAPYKSMVTGEIIGGRAQHREHLKQYRLEEVGNETKYLKPKPKELPPGLRDIVARNVYQKL